MRLEIKTIQSAPEILPVNVVLDGKIIGDIRPIQSAGQINWHAAIHVGDGPYGELIQGHGQSHREAIANAIKNGREETEKLLRHIDIFAAAVGYEVGAE